MGAKSTKDVIRSVESDGKNVNEIIKWDVDRTIDRDSLLDVNDQHPADKVHCKGIDPARHFILADRDLR